MSVELRPLGVTCNIQCQYCYQDPQRDARDGKPSYDIQRMKEAILAEGGPFTLFGGEPLMLPLDDLETLFAWGLERFGSNGVQTNGVLITDAHIALFRRYQVQVGVSMDGPGELNDARWHGTLERTRQSTEASQRAIVALCEGGVPTSVIITLHRVNALSERLSTLLAWVRELDQLGVRWIRLHLLESEDEVIDRTYALETKQAVHALLQFARLQDELANAQFDMFSDMQRMLLGQDQSVTCVWGACDPYTTEAVRGVEGDGRRTNCGRTNKLGIDFVKSAEPGFERYLALYHTPREHGGCSGCRFFLMCKGQCPGTSIGGDWRNRTEHCEIYEMLYTWLEKRMLEAGANPLSRSPLRPYLERAFLEAWSQGQNASMALVMKRWQQQGVLTGPPPSLVQLRRGA